MRKRLFALTAFAYVMSINTCHVKDDFHFPEIPRVSKKHSSRRKLSRKQIKARNREKRAKQARKINYQNQKKGIVNPNNYLSKTHKSWKDKL